MIAIRALLRAIHALLRCWPALVVIVLLGGVYYWGWSNGHNKAALACERARNVDAAESKKFADELNRKLQAALSNPQAPKVKEVIRANPSDCDVPKPVADSLREAIRAANAAE